MKRTAPTYYAITATTLVPYYDRSGNERRAMNWWVVSGPHSSRDEAYTTGKEKLPPLLNNSGQLKKDDTQTQYANLCVISKSQLQKYRIEE